mmetsp:Transcript_28660/g.55934  ORF Transcript_28660/g.55934 Transcript_28660/m.55934 type:complete len:386 (-) Transcript_28660:346-1503(-)|eukprot:CAMPEP_0173391734 /NCGR_PEP_ID=MMETSP1356-20130122/18557_1 /TAXON_ID=77927 ORGANISM="Hemiselmis virescens, Strain PCC157" /NCGR_SAMPLE_ID=MMETSP1356 /ASSEMBLY_ACC=CAM_ASM_000847 /LENGTH=385 /DNA_ID=CAMNT_0014349417 /DNA_START=211 /DNA_END=1368 /DNA_ORIENTATION=+
MTHHTRTTALLALLALNAAAHGFVLPSSSVHALRKAPAPTSSAHRGTSLTMVAAMEPDNLAIFPRGADVQRMRGGVELGRTASLTLHRPVDVVAPVATKQMVLIVSATLSYMFIATFAPVTLMALFDNGIFLPFLQNITPAALCFGGADVVTQLVTLREDHKRSGGLGFPFHFDAWRSASASFTGILCNAIGLTVWLHFLNTCLPHSCVGLKGTKLGLLVAKTMTHAFVWGTLSNSISLVLRRILAGDSAMKSVEFWNSKILSVTKTNFAFWPAWMLINFALVPQQYHVRFTAVGAFCFNIFMSYISSQKTPIAPLTPPLSVLHVDSLPEHPVVPKKRHMRQKWLDDEVFALCDVITGANAAQGVQGAGALVPVPVPVTVPTENV